MRTLRCIEAASGLLATLAGGIALVYLLTIPSYSGEGCYVAIPGEPPICVTRTATLLQVNGAAAVANLGIVAVVSLGAGLAAVWHSRTGRRGARTLLWGATAALVVYAMLSLLSIGVLLLPSAAFALVACASSLGRSPVAASHAVPVPATPMTTGAARRMPPLPRRSNGCRTAMMAHQGLPAGLPARGVPTSDMNPQQVE